MDNLTENFERAYNYAIYLLSLKLRTEGEIREKLKSKKYESKICDAIILQLYENNYLDDSKYALVYLENLKKYKSFGYYGIKKKLMEKKLPSELIEKVLSEGLSIEEEIKIAKRLIGRSKVIGNREAEVTNELPEPEENTYSVKTYGQEKDPVEIKKQKTLSKLKSRGFRGGVLSKLMF
jgi:regulatory protein